MLWYAKSAGIKVYTLKTALLFQPAAATGIWPKEALCRSRLPVKLRDYTFAGFDFCYYPEGVFPEKRKMSYREVAQSTFEAAQNFARNTILQSRGKGLFIYGNVGSGKTYLCSAIANYLLENGKEVLFIVVPDLLDEIRASYSGISNTLKSKSCVTLLMLPYSSLTIWALTITPNGRGTRYIPLSTTA